jgi:hypothetical protein
VVQFHPVASNVPKVVFAGRVSLTTGAAAVLGPPLVTICVYVMTLPAVTGFGLADWVKTRSAWVPVAMSVTNVAELLLKLESCEVVATFTVSVMLVPPVAL